MIKLDEKKIDICKNTDELREFILKRPEKLGLASAYVDGFKFGVKNNLFYIIYKTLL